jgi:hypothetical protein
MPNRRAMDKSTIGQGKIQARGALSVEIDARMKKNKNKNKKIKETYPVFSHPSVELTPPLSSFHRIRSTMPMSIDDNG